MTVTLTMVEAQSHHTIEVSKPVEGASPDVTTNQGPVGDKKEITGTPAMVTVDLGFTKNLGDFQSLKVRVAVTVPTSSNPEDIALSAEWAKVFCESKVEEILNDS